MRWTDDPARREADPPPGSPEPVPEDIRRMLLDVARRGDADLFRDLARCWDVPEAERRRLWRPGRTASQGPRRGLLDGAARSFIPNPALLWRGLFQRAVPLSWRERRRILLLWLVALILVAVPLAFLSITLRDYLTLLPLPR